MTTGYNPIADTYAALWDMLNAKADFVALFSLGRQVRLDQLAYNPDSDLDMAAPNDYPRCRLAWDQSKAEMQASSSDSRDIWHFDLQVCTGDQQQTSAWDVYWAVYRACSDWQQYVAAAVTWQGLNPVLQVWPELSHNLGHDEKAWNRHKEAVNETRGTHQWVSYVTINVMVSFSTLAIQGN